MELVETAQNSAGRSEEQFAKYSDSLTYKVNALKNTWEQLRISLLDAEVFKQIVDLANTQLTKISKLSFKKLSATLVLLLPVIKSFILKSINLAKNSVNNFANVGTAIANKIAEGFNYIANKTSLNLLNKMLGIEKANEEITKLEAKLQWLKTQPVQTLSIASETAQVEKQIQKLQEQLDRGNARYAATQKAFVQTTSQGIIAIAQSAAMGIGLLFSGAEWEDALDAAGNMLLVQVATMGMELISSVALKMVGVNATIATGSVTAAATANAGGQAVGTAFGVGLDAGLASTGIGLLIVGVFAVIGLAAKKIAELTRISKENNKTLNQELALTEQRLKEVSSMAKEDQSQAETSKKELENAEELKNKYEELHKIKVKTAQEEEDYKEVISQIREQYPSIVTYYNEMTGELQVQNDLWNNILETSKKLAKEDALKAYYSKQLEIIETDTKTEQQNKKLTSTKEALQNDRDYISLVASEAANYGDDTSVLQEKLEKYDIYLTNSELDQLLKTASSNPDGLSDFINKLSGKYNVKKEEESNTEQNNINNIQQYIENTTDYSGYAAKIAAEKTYKELDQDKYKTNVTNLVWDPTDEKLLTIFGDEETFKKDYLETTDRFQKNQKLKEYNEMVVSSDLENQIQELQDDELKQIEDFKNNFSQYTEEQYKNFIDNAKEIYNMDENKLKEIFSATDQLNSAKRLREAYNINTNDLNFEQISGLDSKISDFEKNAGTDKTKDFISKLSYLKDYYNLTTENFAELIDLDWETLNYANENQFKESFLKILDGVDIPEEDIQNLLSDSLTSAISSGISTYSSTNIEGVVDTFLGTVQTKIDENDKISKAIKAQIENGFISWSESKTFEEELTKVGMDAEKYLSYGENGEISIDMSTFYQDYVGSLDLIEDIIDGTIEENLRKIEILKVEIEQLEARGGNSDKIAELKAEQKALEQTNENYKEGSALREEAKNKYLALNKELSSVYAENYEKLDENLQKAIDAVNKAQKDVDNAAKKVNEQLEKVQDALEKINDAQEKVIEAQDKLNEALYGSENRKSSLDGLYNYTTNLGRLEKKANDAKTALEDLTNTENPNDLFNTYVANTKGWITTQKAENQVRQQDVNNNLNVLDNEIYNKIAQLNAENPNRNLDTNLRNYYTKVGDRINVNFAAIADAQLPDDFKSYIEERIQAINEQYNAIEDNEDKIAEKEKELNELQKKLRKEYINLEEKVINTLKEKYEEEIKDKEDKNKALEEADNDYLDALKKNIEKQRKLRDEAEKTNDLAEKQKKLSLMQRDTSGSNAKDIKNLQKDIQKDQKTLFDSNVDNILDGLKELYDLQKETREAEIEYQKAVIDNAALVLEANELINSWESPEDMYEWMLNNQKDLSEMTQAQLEEEKDSWEEMFRAKELYMTATSQDFSDALLTQEMEIQDVVMSTSEILTSEAQRSLNEVTDKINESIKSVEDSLKSALDSLADAQDSYNDALENLADARQDLIDKQNELAEKQSELNKQQDIYTKAGGDNVSAPTYTPTLTANEFVTKGLSYKVLEQILSSNSSNKSKQLEQWVNNANVSNLTDEQRKSAYNMIVEYYKTIASGRDLGDLSTNLNKKLHAYASGGLVNYTGPAWVDGTPSKPEAFLSAEDTERIGMAAKLLANASLLTYQTDSSMSPNIGDTSIEVHINVDSISSDYDVDRLAERVKQDIINAANPIGSSIILNKT